MTVPILMSKQRLREELLSARLRQSPAERAERSRVACERLISLEPFRAARTLALYAAMGAEADPAWAAREAMAAGKRIAWPRLTTGSRTLVFAACAPDDLVRGELGTREPPVSAREVSFSEIDLVVVPGVGFDAAGRRLGRGGGYYDATLIALPAQTMRLALAFDLQVVQEVPGELHDVSVDCVVTELRVLWTPRSPP